MANRAIVELPNGIVVERIKMIGCDWYRYVASIKVNGYFGLGVDGNKYSSFGSVEGYGPMANVGSRQLPSEIEALPSRTQERIDAVNNFYKEQSEIAYRYVLEAFPAIANLPHEVGTFGDVEYHGTNPA